MTISSNRRGFPARAALLLALAAGIGLSSGAEVLAQSRQAPLAGPSLALPRLSRTVLPQRTAVRATPRRPAGRTVLSGRPSTQQLPSGYRSRHVEGEALATLVVNKSPQPPQNPLLSAPPKTPKNAPPAADIQPTRRELTRERRWRLYLTPTLNDDY